MILVILIVALLITLSLNLFFWRTGAIGQAEDPELVMDVPVSDAKERKVILKRLHRWKEEGRLSPTEYENFTYLCESEWNP